MLVREEYRSYEREIPDQSDILAVTVRTTGGDLTIICTYMATEKKEHHERNRIIVQAVKRELIKQDKKVGKFY